MMRARGMIFAAAVLCAIAAHAQTQARVTIVALGASNTEGWGVSAAEAYPAKLQALLNARGIDAAVINAGIAAHWAPIRHRELLHDRASYRYYWQVIERARRTGQPLPAEAEQAWFGDTTA